MNECVVSDQDTRDWMIAKLFKYRDADTVNVNAVVWDRIFLHPVAWPKSHAEYVDNVVQSASCMKFSEYWALLRAEWGDRRDDILKNFLAGLHETDQQPATGKATVNSESQNTGHGRDVDQPSTASSSTKEKGVK